MKQVFFTTKCAWATASLLILIYFEAYMFVGFLDWQGWFTWKKALLCVAAPTLVTLTAAGMMHRYLPFKIVPIAAANVALLVLLWQYPITTTPQFFIAADHVKLGMTVRELEKQMQGFPCGRNVMFFSTISSEEVEATSHGIAPSFTGELVYKSYVGSYSAECFTIKAGIVTGIQRQFMLD